MSTQSKSAVVNIFTILVIFLTAFQGMIPAMPITNETTLKTISAIVLFLVSGFTLWKQWLSVEVDSKSVKPTLILTIIATLGAVNEMFDVVTLDNTWAQWIRFGVTFITMALNVLSKLMWPTEETKSKF